MPAQPHDLARLAEEYYRDGNMKFTVPKESVSVTRQGDRIAATGKAVVSRGGRRFQVSLELGPSGSLKPDDVKISGRVLPTSSPLIPPHVAESSRDQPRDHPEALVDGECDAVLQRRRPSSRNLGGSWVVWPSVRRDSHAREERDISSAQTDAWNSDR